MTREKFAVILVSPMEISLRKNKLSRENKIVMDADNFKKSKVNALYLKQFRENIGIGSLAAYLRERDLSAKIINCNIEHLSVEAVAEDIITLNPKVVAISLLYDLHIFNGFKLANLLKERGYTGHITVGGAFSTLAYEPILKNIKSVDSVIRGEGEISLYNLVQSLAKGDNWTNISSIAYRNESNIICNKCTDCIDDLSDLPFVARDSLNKLRMNGIPVKVASIYSSRGCKGNCTYCTAPSLAMLYENKWRFRSAQHVVDEIEQLVNDYGINYFYFCDDNFFGYGSSAVNRLEEMAKEIIQRNLKIRFHAEVRVDNKIDDTILKLLKQAGLKDVLLGLESGSQSVLNRWKKGTTVKQNLRTVELLRNLGFNIEPAMILMDAHMTKAEFKETVEFIEEAQLHMTEFPLNMFNKMIVFTETKLYKTYLENGIINKEEDSINNQDDFYDNLTNLCKQVSYSEYTIYDNRMEIMWNVLMRMVDELSFLIEDYFPSFSGELITRSRLEDSAGRIRSLEEIKSIKLWRKDIGVLCINLLKICCQWLETNDDDMVLTILLNNEVKSYDHRYLKENICSNVDKNRKNHTWSESFCESEVQKL